MPRSPPDERQVLMLDLRGFTLWARKLLTEEGRDLLQQVYGLDSSGTFRPEKQRPALANSTEAMETRRRLERLIDDEVDAGFSREFAVAKLIKEIAFTHLNRFVAFKLMEARGLIRSPLSKLHESNGFKMYLGT